jgi:hypothetical protein
LLSPICSLLMIPTLARIVMPARMAGSGQGTQTVATMHAAES